MAVTKTPVSLLQEMSAKLKIPPPEFDLIFSRSEGVNPEFKYQVIFKGLSAVGCGRSKKEAKHNAAEMLYTKLNNEKSSTLKEAHAVMSFDEPVASPYTNQVVRNYVGELGTLCAEKLPDPLYEEVAAEGPSHAPSFTISCKVLKFTEKAQSSTKKQAKQLVAKKMLSRVSECLKTLITEPRSPKRQTDAAEDAEKIFERLDAMPRIPVTCVSNSINELHLLLEQAYPETPALLRDVDVDKDTSKWNPVERVKALAGEMNVAYSLKVNKTEGLIAFNNIQEFDDLPSSPIFKKSGNAPVVWYAILTLETNPHTVVMGNGGSASAAEKHAAERTLAHLSVLIEGTTFANKRRRVSAN